MYILIRNSGCEGYGPPIQGFNKYNDTPMKIAKFIKDNTYDGALELWYVSEWPDTDKAYKIDLDEV